MDGHPGSTPDTVTVRWCTTDGDERRKAHALLLRTAAELLRVPSSEIWLEHEPGGRPYLGGAGAGLSVSLAHARGTLAVALTSKVPVGIDVEVVRALRAETLARTWLHPAEAEWVSALAEPERAAAFLWLWTQKESVGKALGQGLRRGGMSRRMPLAQQWPPDTVLVPRPLPGAEHLVSSAVLLGGGRYVLGLALRGGSPDGAVGDHPVQVRRVDLDAVT